MTTTKKAIGQLKSKVTKQCTICGCSTRRNLTADVFENTPTEIERAKQEIKEKAAKKYTCRICKSIERDLSSQGLFKKYRNEKTTENNNNKTKIKLTW